MKFYTGIMTFFIGIFVLYGCAVTPLSSEAKNVRVISEQQAKNCRFINTVSANNGNTLSESPEQEARNKAMNRVAELGGNSLRITTTNTQIAPSGVGSIFSLSGEAYSCQ
jgi:hypothetical protein